MGTPPTTDDTKKRKAAPQVSNADFIMDHILKKCSDMQSANKFFKWLRDNPNSKIRGRLFLASEIDEAEARCRQVWQSQKSADEEEEAKQRAEQKEALSNLSNVDMIVNQVMKKADDMSKAEKYFDMLNRTVGQKNALGRVFTAEEITQAWLECQERFETQAAPKPSGKRKAEKVEQVSGVDTILRYVLRKCDDMERAQKIFDMLYDTVGK